MLKKISARWHPMSIGNVVASAVLISWVGFGAGPIAADECDSSKMSDFTDLMSYLREDTRRNSEYRIIQSRTDLSTVAPRHPQNSYACFFYSAGAIVEHLGYARWQRHAHDLTASFHYRTTNNALRTESLDVGYFGSPEHMMLAYVDGDTLSFGQKHYAAEFLDDQGKDLNRKQRGCAGAGFFKLGQEYGYCDPDPSRTRTFDNWVCRIGAGCGGGNHKDCACSTSANCGIFWFMNQELQNRGMAGCNDARYLKPTKAGHVVDIRRIVKAFVDNETPLIIGVKNGKHFMVLIGYADLEEQTGLPETAIAVDPSFHDTPYASPGHRYWILRNIGDLEEWYKPGSCSMARVIPWNQHLGGGCAPGGWARKLDGTLANHAYRLCTPQGGSEADAKCVAPFYGITVTCNDNGKARQIWHRPINDAFITHAGRLDCDELLVEVADGERTVSSANARRYAYHQGSGRWRVFSNYDEDSIIVTTDHEYRDESSQVSFGTVWKDDYWLVASGLPGTYTKRRTTITLNLNTGEKVFVEISPPRTYGTEVSCYRGGKLSTRYFEEAGSRVFDGEIFFEDKYDRTCDRLELNVNLGAGSIASKARVQRFGYNRHTAKAWQLYQTWRPDIEETRYNGLTGLTRHFVWDNVWRDNYWLVADNIGAGGSQDRETRISVQVGEVDHRVIHIVPY